MTIEAMTKMTNMLKLCLSLALGALGTLAVPAGAQMHHAQTSKIELGTSSALDGQGRLWIASREAGPGKADYVVLQHSSDTGRTWSTPQRVQQTPEPISADGENRPKLAFGIHGEIYVAYTKPLAKPYTGEIRFARSLDGGRSFSAPVTVHANRDQITHRFESMIVDRQGRIYIAWIDKRDAEAARSANEKYRGAALYYAVSNDAGASFNGDLKIADHSCECCRIALALNPAGKPVALWRHVFEPNARDHALAELTPDGAVLPLIRASFDDWRIDACPHQGPALAYAQDGTRHQTWFNLKGDEGGVFYAAASPAGALGKPVRLGDAQAAHADVMVDGATVALAWKQFNGSATVIFGKVSRDGGATWRERALASTSGNSDQPHLQRMPSGIALLWRTQQEGVRIIEVTP